MSQAYPLAWPLGWKRTPAHRRTRAIFGKQVEKKFSGGQTYMSKDRLSLEDARKRLVSELARLGAGNVVLSTNLVLRADGWPKSGQRAPEDVGAAVYFDYAERKTVLACDRWDRIEDNIAALAKHIEAMRGMDRWGVGSVEQAFTGYAALPAPDPWWQVLGLPGPTRSAEEIREAWAKASRNAHPDRPGGSHDKQARVNIARDEGLAVLVDQTTPQLR
jgi:hypothetical protein